MAASPRDWGQSSRDQRYEKIKKITEGIDQAIRDAKVDGVELDINVEASYPGMGWEFFRKYIMLSYEKSGWQFMPGRQINYPVVRFIVRDPTKIPQDD